MKRPRATSQTFAPLLWSIASALLLCAWPAHAQSLAETKATFERALRAIDTDTGLKTVQMQDRYTALMEEAKASAQKAGELDNLLAIDETLKAFRETPTFPAIAAPGPLQAIQASLITANKKVQDDAQDRRKAATLHYFGALKDLKVHLTKTGEIDAAIEVSTVINDFQRAILAAAPPPAAPEAAPERPRKRAAEKEPNRPILWNRNAYRLYEQVASWDEAQNVCRAAGGNLVVINSLEEHKFLQKLVDGKRAWIGARLDKDGNWRWLDRRPVRAFPGITLEGKDGPSQPCLTLDGGAWRDLSATASRRVPVFVCEWIRR